MQREIYFFWANQWKADIKFFSWTEYEINKDRRDWHILAGIDTRINLNRNGRILTLCWNKKNNSF